MTGWNGIVKLVAAGAVAVLALVALAACGGSAATVDPSFAGASVTVRAVNIAFETTQVTLPAGQPLRIVLDNADAGVPHAIVVSRDGAEISRSAIVTGPAQTEIRFGPLAAGSYAFACTVHPAMTGTLTITP